MYFGPLATSPSWMSCPTINKRQLEKVRHRMERLLVLNGLHLSVPSQSCQCFRFHPVRYHWVFGHRYSHQRQDARKSEGFPGRNFLAEPLQRGIMRAQPHGTRTQPATHTNYLLQVTVRIFPHDFHSNISTVMSPLPHVRETSPV